MSNPSSFIASLSPQAPGSRAVRMEIPGFSKFEKWVGIGPVRLPGSIELGSWYAEFESRVFGALERHEWLPVYRLSDGEFTFMLGRHFDQLPLKRRLVANFKHAVNSVRFKSNFYSSGRKGYCETYPFWTMPKRRAELAEQLREVGASGMLCFNFSDSEISRPYQDRVLNWLSRRGVEISQRSFYHFYHVYGLLRGPRFLEIIRGRKALVLTADINQRGAKIVENLKKMGAADVQFYATSTCTPMLDRIDLGKLRFKPDVVFIGAGVGASNVALQLKSLSCPVIDAGFVVDVWAEPELAERRPYLVQDSEWEKVYPKGYPQWIHQERIFNAALYKEAGLKPLEAL